MVSPLINFHPEFVQNNLPRLPGKPTHRDGNAKILQRKVANLKSQSVSNPLLNRVRSIEEVDRRFSFINLLS